MNNLLLDSILSYLKLEITNEYVCEEDCIIIKLADGTKAKISARKV